MKKVWLSGFIELPEDAIYFLSRVHVETTEAAAQWTAINSLTVSRLRAMVAQLTAGTIAIVDRKNGANGGGSISASTTGQFEDTTGSTSLVNGDLYCVRIAAPTNHGAIASLWFAGYCVEDNGNNVMWAGGGGGNFSAGPLDFGALTAGAGTSNLLWEHRNVAALTLSRLKIVVSANVKTGASTFFYLVGGATGSGVSVSVGAGLTGSFEDNVNTTSVPANSRFNVRCTTADSSNFLTLTRSESWISSEVHYLHTNLNGGAVSTELSRVYAPIHGTLSNFNATELFTQSRASDTKIIRNLGVYVNSNARTTATAVNLRANAANAGTNAISIPSSSSGVFSDTTGSYTPAATDLINYAVLPGAGSGSITFYRIQSQVGEPSVPKSRVPHNLTNRQNRVRMMPPRIYRAAPTFPVLPVYLFKGQVAERWASRHYQGAH